MPKIRALISLLVLTTLQHGVHAQKLHLECFGSSVSETQTIDKIGYAKSFDNYNALETEISNLKQKLILQGYINILKKNVKRQNDSSYLVYFTLRNKYESIEIENTSLVDIKLLKKTGFLTAQNTLLIPINQIEPTLEFINKKLANQGDPFITLELRDISKKNNSSLKAKLVISKSSSRTIDNIIIKGYNKFPTSFIQRYLKIKSSDQFSFDEIKEKSKALNNLVFANQMRDPEVLFTKDSTILYMYLEKTKSNTFDGYLGFGTNESNGKIEFDGYLNLNLINNLNFGESLKLLYKSDENDQQTFDLKINAPYIFKTPVGLSVNLNIFKRDSSFATVTQNIKLNYQINTSQRLSAGVTSVSSTDLLEIPSLQIEDYNSQVYLLAYTYTLREHLNPLFPIQCLFDISGGVGKRRNDSNNESQSYLTVNTLKIFNLNDKNSIYGRLNGRYLKSDSYLENELPRFGGINSIRGFEENSLIANLYAVLNTEYRYQLNDGIYVHSVIDAAYFENRLTNQKEKLFGFGFGFGLITKAGLFKLNYTTGKTEDTSFKLSDSKIHLSLSTTF